MAQSASPPSVCCTLPRVVCGLGARNTATTAIGPRGLALQHYGTVLTDSGLISPHCRTDSYDTSEGSCDGLRQLRAGPAHRHPDTQSSAGTQCHRLARSV